MGAWEFWLNLDKLMLWTNRQTVWVVGDYKRMQGYAVGKKIQKVFINSSASNTEVFCQSRNFGIVRI